jgi:tetratricopeptide (TPR) repeat protein
MSMGLPRLPGRPVLPKIGRNPEVPLIAVLGTIVIVSSSPILAQESSLEPLLEPIPTAADSAGPFSGPDDVERTGIVSPDSEGIRAAIEAGELEKALDRIRTELAGSPSRPREERLRLLEARVLDHLGESWEATRIYRRVLGSPAVGRLARRELHDLYIRRGQFRAADRLTAPGGEGTLTDEDRHLRAFSRSVQGRYAEAARLVAPLAARGDAVARVLRANALLALGDRDGAESLFLTVVEEGASAPVRQAAHFGLGQVARLRGGRAVRALQDESAVALGPAPWAELDLGLALRALGRREEASKRLQQVASDHPYLEPTARLGLSRLHEEVGDFDAALDELAASLDGSLGDFLGFARAGELLIQEGREEQGVEAYRVALEIFPDFPPAREKLTRALAQRGRWEEAMQGTSNPDDPWNLPGWTWERLLDGDLPFFAISADRDSIPVGDPRRAVLALVQLRAGNTGGALGWSEGADADHPVLAAIRAEALELVDRKEEAEQLWVAILDSGAETPVGREHLALLAFDRDPDLAIARWEALFEEYPRRVRARIRMARILTRAKLYDEALEAYRAVQESAWLTPGERDRLRVERQDVEDIVAEREDLEE